MLLKQLDIRPQTRLAPIRTRVTPPREVFQFEQQPADGGDGIGVERVDLGGEEGDTDFACAVLARSVSSEREGGEGSAPVPG